MSETQSLNGPLSEAAEIVNIPKSEALLKFKEYSQALRTTRTQHDRMMKAVYGALSEGLGVINPRQAIIKAGIDGQGFPKLAICRAEYETVYFRRTWSEVAFFSSFSGKYLASSNKAAQSARLQFHFPDGTLPKIEGGYQRQGQGYREIVKATVPIIPPAHRPDAMKLGEYSILWEVEKWEALPRPQRPPGDPMLLKPLAQTGLYAVVAHWDLSDIEKMVLGAMYGS